VVEAGNKETLFVYTSDNGPRIDDAKASLGGDVGPFNRGGKWGPYEGGHRMPMVLYWPGVIAPGITSALVSHMDLFPTFLSLGKAKVSKNSPIDGVDLTPLFVVSPQRRDACALRSGLLINEGFAARIGRFKVLLRNQKKKIIYDVFDVDVNSDTSESNPIQNASLVRKLLIQAKVLSSRQRESLNRDFITPPLRIGKIPESACFCTACANRRKWNCALDANSKQWPRNIKDVNKWLTKCASGPMVYSRDNRPATPNSQKVNLSRHFTSLSCPHFASWARSIASSFLFFFVTGT